MLRLLNGTKRVVTGNFKKRNYSMVNKLNKKSVLLNNVITKSAVANIAYYLPFCPRPTINVDKEFMDKLFSDSKDDKLIKDKKEDLYNIFIKIYPGTVVDHSPHYDYGVISRLLIHTSMISLFVGGTEAAAIIVIACYAYLYLCAASLMYENTSHLIQYKKLIELSNNKS